MLKRAQRAAKGRRGEPQREEIVRQQYEGKYTQR